MVIPYTDFKIRIEIFQIGGNGLKFFFKFIPDFFQGIYIASVGIDRMNLNAVTDEIFFDFIGMDVPLQQVFHCRIGMYTSPPVFPF